MRRDGKLGTENGMEYSEGERDWLVGWKTEQEYSARQLF